MRKQKYETMYWCKRTTWPYYITVVVVDVSFLIDNNQKTYGYSPGDNQIWMKTHTTIVT